MLLPTYYPQDIFHRGVSSLTGIAQLVIRQVWYRGGWWVVHIEYQDVYYYVGASALGSSSPKIKIFLYERTFKSPDFR